MSRLSAFCPKCQEKGHFAGLPICKSLLEATLRRGTVLAAWRIMPTASRRDDELKFCTTKDCWEVL
jgi:hypothetical protein